MLNMHRQVLILAGSQALFQSISVLIMTIGGLAGALLTPSLSLITVPLSMASLGTVLVMFPASLWMSRAGRKIGFITGALCGIVAAVISMIAMFHHSFILGTVAKLAMRQPFVLFKGLTFQKLCLPGAFRPGITIIKC